MTSDLRVPHDLKDMVGRALRAHPTPTDPVFKDEKGVAGGVPSLDAFAHVPAAQVVNAGGWSDLGGAVVLQNPVDQVIIGAIGPVAAEQLRVTGGVTLLDHTDAEALVVAQTGGGTKVLIVNTVDQRVGIGMVPVESLSVNGNIRLGGDHDILPNIGNTGEVGTDLMPFSRVRAQNVVTGDLDLKAGDGSAHWTIQELPDGIRAVNRKTMKSYRMMLREE